MFIADAKVVVSTLYIIPKLIVWEMTNERVSKDTNVDDEKDSFLEKPQWRLTTLQKDAFVLQVVAS